MNERETYTAPRLDHQPNLREITKLDQVISPVVMTPDDTWPCTDVEPL